MSPARDGFLEAVNLRTVSLETIPCRPLEDFRGLLLRAVRQGLRLSSLFGARLNMDDRLNLFAVLADDTASRLLLTQTRLDSLEYPALTPDCPQAHLFEREIFENFAVRPLGHPWLKPVRFPKGESIGIADFYLVGGDEIHEVAVGPVHAGVIEPGHFRFQCHGELVHHLEISLGYQHRGIEKAFVGGPDKRTLRLAETLAGDSSIAHAMACCQAVESLSGCHESARSQALRGIALELERMANHVGDLGALAGDVGFLTTASYCGRIRGDILNMTGLICGSRFGRCLLDFGGARFDIPQNMAQALLTRIEGAEADLDSALSLLWEAPSVMARFEGIGAVDRETCRSLGIVGPAARASGLMRDVRQDHPSGIFRFSHIPISLCESGDVFARAQVRALEVQRSIAYVREQLQALPAGELRLPCESLAPDSLCVSLTEGWRGEVCHTAITGPDGKFACYKVVDPSFHNWSGLAMALRGQQISDFPLCNKSFNLSYCGHDL